MSLIAEVAYEVVAGRFKPFDAESGYCLRNVREIVQEALGIDYEQFYRHYRTHTVEDNLTGIPWARDVQLSLRFGWYGVPYERRRPGDLVFSWAMGRPQGHVAVIAGRPEGGTLIVENTSTQRGFQLSGYNRLSRLEDWPSDELEVFRLER